MAPIDGADSNFAGSYDFGLDDPGAEHDRGIAANMSLAAQVAHEASELAAQAQKYAQQYRLAKAQARQYAEQAMAAAAVVESSAIASARSDVSSAATVENAHGAAGALDTTNLTGSAQSAVEAADIAEKASENATLAVANYRQAEAVAMEAARNGLEIARQIVGKINITVVASRFAAESLATPMAEAERIVAAGGATDSAADGQPAASVTSGEPAASLPAAAAAGTRAQQPEQPPASEGETTPVQDASGLSPRITETINSVVRSISGLLGPNGTSADDPATATSAAVPTKSPTEKPQGSAAEDAPGSASFAEISGWIAFGVLLLGTVVWCRTRA